MNEWLLNLFQVLYILKMVQVVLVLGILLSTIQIDLAIPANGKFGYHVISVIPSPDAPCNETELQCLTLSQIANSSSDYLVANMTLHFLPGEHSLDSTLLIKNSDSLYASSLDSNVTIACSHSSASFEFSNISVVHISGLTFTGCTGNKFININQLTLEDSKFIGDKDSTINGPAVELIESSAKLIRTELSHYYGSRVTSLLCENGDHWLAEDDFLYGENFIDNIAVSATAGGAIVSTHSNVIIDGSVFEGNSAQAGGAIFAEQQSNITIINSTFVGNQATALQSHQYCYFGGGVLYSDDGSSVTIQDSMLERNTAHWLGGVVATSLHGSVIVITNSDFISNSANYLGGVLYNGEYSDTIITDSAFTNNSAYYDGGVLGVSHAAFAVISITNSEFTNNSANRFGGVLGLDWFDNLNITITNSEFTNNSVNQYGGVLYLWGVKNSNITITNSEFTNNSANRDGGVLDIGLQLYVYRRRQLGTDNISIVACTFVDNKAGGAGGALKMRYATDVSVVQSNFSYNKAREGGAMHIIHVRGSVIIHYCQIYHNVANFGGVLWTQDINNIDISCDTSLYHNRAYGDGGVLYARNSPTTITGANFSHNRADNNGGMMYTEGEKTFITDCIFDNNTAGNDGGVIRSYQSTIDISESEYNSNSANNEGGVFHIDQTDLIIHQTSFVYSKANDGGVIWIDQGDLVINHSSFGDNNASAGGVIWAEQAKLNATTVNITDNYANVGVVYLLESTSDWSDIWYSNNVGSLYALGGEINIKSGSNFTNNTQPSRKIVRVKEGGAITTIQSKIVFIGKSWLTKGHAKHGGALKALHSKVYFRGNVRIDSNTATEAGGGIYLYHSELICWKKSTLTIWENTAKEKGGGISATGSVIKVKRSLASRSLSILHFNSNKAINGGGLFLKMDSQIHILKSRVKSMTDHHRLISFSLNAAQYGGAIYVSDSDMCRLSSKSVANEALAMYSPMPADFDPDDYRCQNIAFVNNTAKVSGNSLFGGLLDRCTVSQFAETNINNVNMDYTFSNGTMIVKGHEYFQKISNVQDRDIDSPPLRVCFCINGQPNCSHQHDPILIRKGQQQNISLSLAVVNQIHNPLQNATILSHFHSTVKWEGYIYNLTHLH